MHTPDFEVHRAVVHSADPVTGDASVRIPALLGATQVVSIPTTGLTNSDGFWNVPSVGSSVFVAVSDDRTQFYWLTAVGISGSGGDDPSNEPIGHEDRTGSLIAFDNATRTFSIQPANGSYVVWCVGLRYEKANLESIQIPNVTGLYYISFNAQGQLQYSEDFFVWDQDCPTAYVYWNSTTQRAEFFADERHGITMDWQTHEYLHRTRGAAYANGFDASNFDTSTRNGNTDAQAKLDIDNGTFFDEDLQVDVRHSLAPAQNTWEQQLQGPARIPVFYRSGTSYVYDAPTDFPVKQGTTHPRYNSSSGGNWSTIELGANTYGIQWIVATNQLNYPILSIMGQTQYANVGQAEAASWADMDLDGLPIVEIRVLYKIIFRATGSNTPGCYFEQIDDYRNALSNATSTAAAVVDHGNLTGLADDDHPQYAFRNTSPTITLAGDATGSVTLTDLGDGTLTVAVVNDSHTHDNRYYQRDGIYTTSDILTFQSNDNMRTSSGSQAALQVYQDTTNADAFMTFHVSGDYAVYFGLDGGINDLAVGGWSMGNTAYRIWHEGNDGSGSGLDADLLDGLHLHTGRNNEANKVVRTDGNGYIQAGWINTTSGSHSGTVSRIYASNDAYIRYMTPANFRASVTDGSYVNVGGDTMTGELVISNSAPQIKFNDTTAGADDFWIHINGNRFYILADRDDNGAWDGAYPLELNASTNIGYVFGSQISTVGHTHSYLSTSGGALSGSLRPSSNDAYDLGTNSYKWRFLYTSQGIRFNDSSGTKASFAYDGSAVYTYSDDNVYMAESDAVVVRWRATMNGNGASYNTAGTWGTYSDPRLKTFVDTPDYTDKVFALTVRKYLLSHDPVQQRDDETKQPLPVSFVARDHQPEMLGFNAEEVEAISPGLVEADEWGVKTIKTTVLVPMLVQTVQSLHQRISDLESKLALG